MSGSNLQQFIDPNLHKILNCYNTVLEMLVDRNFKTFKKIIDYEDFSDSNVKIPIEQLQFSSFDDFKQKLFKEKHCLDFLTILAQKNNILTGSNQEDQNNTSKIYVFFYSGQIDVKFVRNTIVERMSNNTINRCILISIGCLGGNITNQASKMLQSLQPTYLIELFAEKELIRNISKHRDVPKHIPLNEQEKHEVLKAYKAKSSNLPTIRSHDPMARYLGLQPGQMVKIIRISENSLYYNSYRICVP